MESETNFPLENNDLRVASPADKIRQTTNLYEIILQIYSPEQIPMS